MKKVLVIDREFNTINSLTMFCATLGLETVVVHNWPSQVKSLNPKELVMIFVNVELQSVHIDKLFQSFEQEGAESVPIVFIYSRTYDPRFVQAQEYPFFGHIKKPLSLNEVYSCLSKISDITEISAKNSDPNIRLREYETIYKEMYDWVEILSKILNKQAPDAQ